MKIFYIEKKSFCTIREDLDYQFADVGIQPLLYTSEMKALRKAKRLTDYLIENCRYDLTDETDAISKQKDNCLYAVQLKERQSSFRMVIRVYQVETR